jgi:hypothetical protein
VSTKRISSSPWCTVAVVALVLFITASASAQLSDERVYFTFSGPVELPGVALAPGKYMFRLVDSTATRNVMQVTSADGRQPYGIFFTIPAERLTPAPEPEVRFMEAPAGALLPIKTWWNVGEITGHEFIYPKEQARRLAKNTKTPVLTTQAETKTTEQTNTHNLTRLSSDGQETKVNGGNKPVASAPSGESSKGMAAPKDIAVPMVIVIVEGKADR